MKTIHHSQLSQNDKQKVDIIDTGTEHPWMTEQPSSEEEWHTCMSINELAVSLRKAFQLGTQKGMINVNKTYGEIVNTG